MVDDPAEDRRWRQQSRHASETRRGTAPADEAYLKRVGERVRLAPRPARHVAQGRCPRPPASPSATWPSWSAAPAMPRCWCCARSRRRSASRPPRSSATRPERPIDLTLALHQLERLSPAELAEARQLLAAALRQAGRQRTGRIALVGLRGAGKTTLGQLAAQALAVPFVELDREIERASGMELSEIFAVHGQAMFRQLERQCLETIVQRFERAVIATGGSLVTEPATYDLLLSTCFVVWLSATPDQHMSRVLAQGDLRPMAEGPQAMDDLKAILESRTPLYAKADAEVNTAEKTQAQAFVALLGVIGKANSPTTS